jgi:hypothetical protein
VNDLLNTLFGLHGMGFGDPGVEFSFARPIPAWGWLLAASIAALIAGYSYWKQDGRRAARVALGVVRAVALLALLWALSGPRLVRPNERIEKDWVVMLVDRSASMTIPDVPGANGARITREQELKDAIVKARPELRKLAQERNVLWLGFDSGSFDLRAGTTSDDAPPVELGNPTGRRTSLGAAIDQALARVAARPVAGVVVLSDGRSFDEPSKQALKRLQSEQIPVLALPLGSAEPVVDLALSSAQAPSLAFVNDTIPVQIEVDRFGGSAGSPPPQGKVQLIDKASGLVLDERPLPREPEAWADGRAHMTLTTKPLAPAHGDKQAFVARTWTVRLIPAQADLVSENNEASLNVELVDRQLRVACFDGYPRWEFRYVKNLLLRERSIRSSNVLLAANRQYLQEGDVLLDTLPRTPEDWAKFDVIIMGDLPASLFGREQIEQLREHVAVRGAGLLWIAGPSATPGSWRDTALAELLPFSLGAGDGTFAQGSDIKAWNEPVLLRPTPAAERLNLFQLADPDQPTTPGLDGWPSVLSDPNVPWARLEYAQRIDASTLKPAAEVLANFVPASSDGTSASSPGVITMRYGAGRVLYVATDEIWRWRYGRGEALPERFWLPLIRLEGRESLARASRPAALEVSPRRPQVDQPVSISVRLQDQSLVDGAPARLAVRVRSLEATSSQAAIDLSLLPEASAGSGKAIARSFIGSWTPTDPGKYRVEVTDAFLSQAALNADVEVTVPDDELRHPETDHPLLARLVSQGGTGSAVLAPDQLGRLEKLPRRDVHIAGNPDTQTLWDRPIVLAALLGLFCLEWAGRRLMKLA